MNSDNLVLKISKSRKNILEILEQSQNYEVSDYSNFNGIDDDNKPDDDNPTDDGGGDDDNLSPIEDPKSECYINPDLFLNVSAYETLVK